MFGKRQPLRASLTLFGGLVALLAATTPALATPRVQDFEEEIPGFPLLLPGDRIVDGSPTLADITDDGRPEIIVGGADGRIYAISVTERRLLWQFRTDEALNATPGLRFKTGTSIRTAPAVGDINGDGRPDIVVGVGDVGENKENGGVVALDRNGRLLPGWPQISRDVSGGAVEGSIDPDGYTDGVETSPAIGDINGDNIPEIVYGSNDQHVWAKRGDGTDLPGWPQFVRDTVHSSPALADLDGNGRNEVIIGIDAHRDDFYGDLDGGYIKVFRTDGDKVTEFQGWPRHEDDIVGSSPAIADVDGDGKLDIVIGVGSIRGQGKHITAYRANGTIIWRAPTDGSSGASPALGDLNGDGQVDVVTLDNTNKVYAFNGKTGRRLWVQTPRSIYAPEAMGKVVLGDWDGDGLDDIFAPVGGQVAVLRGRDGFQYTAQTNPPGELPVYDARSTMNSYPAVGDIDGNGKLELVACAGNGQQLRGICNVWTLPRSSPVTSWPMFHGDPTHNGVYNPREISPSTDSIYALLEQGTRRTYRISFEENWTATEEDARGIISLNRTSGGPNDILSITVTAPRTRGTYTGNIVVNSEGAPSVTIPVTVRSVAQVENVYLPMIRR